ncbi:MAG: adenylyl-sulfate kinase [Rhodospirillales bacterium]|nr:adenylyl-sulfate kinase [Rhodospirillales bacterium]
MVIWICGLSAAGKTTIGARLVALLREEKRPVVFLDGDTLRGVWGDRLGHTLEARRFNAQRIAHLCRMLDRQEINVVASVLYPFSEWQAWMRENLSQFFEVYLDVPMNVLELRDPKGLYAGAKAGTVKNVVGVDLPFTPPANPHLVVENGLPLREPAAIAKEIRGALPAFAF